MTPEMRRAFLTAAKVAYIHRTGLNETELEQVLIALIDLLPEDEGAAANEALYHLRECQKAQLTLKAILDPLLDPQRDGHNGQK